MCLGVIGIVTAVWDEGGIPMATVRDAHAEQPACLLYAPDTRVGTEVLVHLGYVVEVLDPDAAADARELRG